ncbi:MAG: SpoIIE family protein phosphatase [Bacteroidetes bacterium]|nr:SpoIIE family protein phosphatase [Bacteroidota bacterium]
MKKFLFIAVCVFLMIDFAQSQILQTYFLYLGDTINATDINNQKQGRWIFLGKDRKEAQYNEYNENQIIEEGFYQDNNPIGTWKTYHSNSKIQSEIIYKPDEPTQYAKFYHFDGYLIAEGNTKNREFVDDYFIYDSKGNKFKKSALKANEYAKLILKGKVELFGKSLANVTISVVRNGFETKEFTNNTDGSFQLNLELNFDYIVYFSKENYSTQSILVNTDVYNISDTNVYQINNWEVKFYDNFTKSLGTDIAKSLGSEFISLLMNKPAGKVYFKKQNGKFTSDGKYRTFINKQVKGIKKSSKFLLNQVAVDNKRLELENLKIESEKKMNEIVMLRQTQELKEAEIRKKEAEILTQKLEQEKNIKDLSIAQQEKIIRDLEFDQQKVVLEKQKLEAEKKTKEIEHLAILKKIQELELKEKQNALNKTNQDLELSVAENVKRGEELNLAKREKAIKEQELQQKMFYFYILIGGLFLVCLFAFFVVRSLRQKKKANILLEKQSNEILAQQSELEYKNKEIEQKNIETEQSIQYAKRIQNAILPPHEEISAYLNDCFILYKSKDIVSGDFYFFSDKHAEDGRIHIASVDCTGHGVPGAFMSVIGHEKLKAAVHVSSEPGKILAELNRGVKSALRQSSESAESNRDGMDLSICSISTLATDNKHCISYSGANRPLWIVRKNAEVIEEIKATKIAIGGFTEDNQEFEQHELTLEKGDTIYMFSDGYVDQFGGQKKKKLMTVKFKDLILGIQHLSIKEQKDYLDNFIVEWMDGLEQIDDILVIGIKL